MMDAPARLRSRARSFTMSVDTRNDADSPPLAFLDSIQPIVLVGGKSRRFGRDKLREPIGRGAEPLVQRAIDVLREVFGRRVMVVGECHEQVHALADGIITDSFPGIGPIGGITAALRVCGRPIFVLAGDMPTFSVESAKSLLRAACAHPTAHAILASTDRMHPCAGVYTLGALTALEARIAGGLYQLSSALDPAVVIEVACDGRSLVNINWPQEIAP